MFHTFSSYCSCGELLLTVRVCVSGSLSIAKKRTLVTRTLWGECEQAACILAAEERLWNQNSLSVTHTHDL